jgi:adenine-specific DNA-methyltransferase
MKLHGRVNPAIKRNTRDLRREMTDAERMLWRHLRQRQVAGRKFRRQHPVGQYIVDFACLEAGLIIEVDGGQHAERRTYDTARTAWLERQGFRVLRFWNSEVLSNLAGVREVIWREVMASSQPPP